MTDSQSKKELLYCNGSMHIVYVIGAHHRLRWNEIVDHIGLSEPTIATRLDQLEDADLIKREFYDEMPMRTEYSLKPDGEDLFRALKPLFEWASEDISECESEETETSEEDTEEDSEESSEDARTRTVLFSKREDHVEDVLDSDSLGGLNAGSGTEVQTGS